MKWVTLNYYDPDLKEWRSIVLLPRQLKKEMAWKMYLGYQCFRIVNH
jgi:hypothetical protein